MKPDAILCADLHLRDDVPVCRIDNFWETQINKLKFIQDLQKQYDIPVLCSGDVFHRWKASPKLLSMAFKYLPNNFWTIPGNHDLPEHNLKRLKDSGLRTLEIAGKIRILKYKKKTKKAGDFILHGFPFGCSLYSNKKTPLSVAILHAFIYKGAKPFPGATGAVKSILRQIKGFDLILSGDNHQPFTHRKGRTLLVNPGSLTRQTGAQIDHKPRVYLWFSERNEAEPVYLNINKEVVSRMHLDKTKARDERIEQFVKSLMDNFDAGMETYLDFENNMKQHLIAGKVKKKVKLKIQRAMED